MKKLRYGLVVMSLLLCSMTSATAEVSIGISLPNVSIGINLPVYPELVRVPGYPVYYAPRMDANYFFYDGMYWVYMNDNWYASSWYNGPWGIVGPEYVPLFILRIPVSYYRQPPQYFRGWQSNEPPRWDQHWGRDWERQRSGWNRWNRGSAPAPAPLPVYQRQYSGDKYPKVEQQHVLRSQEYRYQPRDKVIRQHFQQVTPKASAPVPQGRKQEPAMQSPRQPDAPQVAPRQQTAPPAPQSRPPQRGGERDQIQQITPKAPAPAPQGRKQEPAMQSPRQPDAPHVAPRQQTAPPAPQARPPQRGQERDQQSAPAQAPQQQRAPAAHEQKQQPAPATHEQRQQPGQAQHEQQAPRKQDRGEPQGGRGQGHRDDDDRGQGRDKDK